jgi:hypothetical protein
LNLDINSVVDSSQNNLLHQIAKSDQAVRFIERLACQTQYQNTAAHLNVTKIIDKSTRAPMLQTLNLDGKTWLEVLVENGNSRALDVAMSLHRNLAWFLFPFYSYSVGRDRLSSLRKCFRRKGDGILDAIFDTFENNLIMIQISGQMQHVFEKTETELMAYDSMSFLRDDNDDAELNAAKFIRFLSDWKDAKDFEEIGLGLDAFFVVAERGYSHLFKLFYQADSSCFWFGDEITARPNHDNNEYIQVRSRFV